MNDSIDITIGVLISVLGILIAVYAFKNQPKKDDNEFSKASNIQLKILGITLFISGLIYAF